MIAIPDEIIDYTYGRAHTYSDSADEPLHHIDFSYPYADTIRKRLVDACNKVVANQFIDRGVYGATQGPRLETAAEIRRLERDGCDLVGMTGMPEAALAAELELPYASLCLVVNPAAGKSEEAITMDDIHRVMDAGMVSIKSILARFIEAQ